MKKNPSAIRVARGLRGRGVFANRPFHGEDAIAQVVGEVSVDPTYSSSYCIDMGDGFTLEPASPFRYLNHSCEPNCEFVQAEPGRVGEPPTVWLYALRTVVHQEELTIDYAWPASHAIRCVCGTAACRGWIVNQDELPLISV